MADDGACWEPLAVVERCGVVESQHYGAIVGLAADGSLALSLGSPDLAILPRSAVKPWQAVAVRRTGLRLSPAATALSAGSHTGQDIHVALVNEILTSASLDVSALGCPPDWPADQPTRERLIAAGLGPVPERMNCSGKHAAMLAAAVAHGWSTQDYLDPAHPLQRMVRAVLEEETGVPVTVTAIDGCGAPLFGTTLLGLAHAARRLMLAADGTDEHAVATAMRSEPVYVGGTGNADTEVMTLLPGVLCKSGAEGVVVAATSTGQAVAAKVVDGSSRATMVILLAALHRLGVDVEAAAAWREVPVLGGGKPVGRIAPSSVLTVA